MTKNEKISCPVYSLFTEKVKFLLVNNEKNSQLKLDVNKQDSWFFVFRHFDQITKNKLMRYIRHKNAKTNYFSGNTILFVFITENFWVDFWRDNWWSIFDVVERLCSCIKDGAAPDQVSIPYNKFPYFVSRFVNDGAAAVAVLDLDTSRANKLIEAVGGMTTTKSAASETKSKVKLCFSFVVLWGIL